MTEDSGDTPVEERSTRELVGRLAEQMAELARKEVELGKIEVTETAKKAGLGAGLVGGAGLFAVLGVIGLLAGAILALAIVLPGWAAAVVVGGGCLAIAGFLAVVGRNEVEEAAPKQLVESAREDVQWAKGMREARR